MALHGDQTGRMMGQISTRPMLRVRFARREAIGWAVARELASWLMSG